MQESTNHDTGTSAKIWYAPNIPGACGSSAGDPSCQERDGYRTTSWRCQVLRLPPTARGRRTGRDLMADLAGMPIA